MCDSQKQNDCTILVMQELVTFNEFICRKYKIKQDTLSMYLATQQDALATLRKWFQQYRTYTQQFDK